MTIIDRNVGNHLAFPKETNNTSLVGIDAKTAGTAKTTFGRERFEWMATAMSMALLSLSVINIKPQIDRSWVQLASLKEEGNQ